MLVCVNFHNNLSARWHTLSPFKCSIIELLAQIIGQSGAMAKMFNPADFAPQDSSQQQQQSLDQSDAPQQRQYETTGNSTRDSVRKLLFEIFSADDDDTERVASLIQNLETQISEEFPDARSRQYRDSSRALQNKLKGTRFIDLRRQLLNGEIKVEDVCAQDYLNGKTTLNAKPSTAPRSGAPTSNMMGRAPGIGRGPPGQAVKPRGAPIGQAFKNLRPSMPLSQAASMPEIPRLQQHASGEDAPTDLQQKQDSPKMSKTTTHQEQPHQEERLQAQIEAIDSPLRRPEQTFEQVSPKRAETQPSNQQTLQEADDQQNTTLFQSFQLDSSQLNITNQSVEEYSLDQIVGVQTQSGVAKKKKKKKKVTKTSPRDDDDVLQKQPPHDEVTQEASLVIMPVKEEDQTNQPIQASTVGLSKDEMQSQAPAQEIVQPKTTFMKQAEEETKEQFKPQLQQSSQKPQPVQQITQPQLLEPAQLQTKQLSLPPTISQPTQQSLRKIQAPEPSPRHLPDTQHDSRLDQILSENLRLKNALRVQNNYEELLLSKDHQLQLYEAQLKGRDEQLIQLRWQMQQAQQAQQREVDDLKARLKRVQSESQSFRDQMLQRLQQQHQTQEFRQQQPPQQQYQMLARVSDEVAADRGSNFLAVRSFQNGGNETQEALGDQLESGEADEGGRDDGHFYRERTADEGTGGAGESYPQPQLQQRVVDVSSSGSGQIPILSQSHQYQRFEHQFVQESAQLIQEDDFDDDEDQTYQTSQHLFPNDNFTAQQRRAPESSSGSAFGEGNQQDDSGDEGMGMGMGNRQGSGHDVEDESGSLDVVAQNKPKNQFKFDQEPQQHVVLIEDDQEGEQNSLEEGGCRSNGDQQEMNSEYDQQHPIMESSQGDDCDYPQEQDLEEEKDEPPSRQIVSDNVERPQPYHPRQQQPRNQTGAAIFPQQITFMQGDSISQHHQLQEQRSVPKMKTAIGGVAVVSRTTPTIPKQKPQPVDSQAGDRPSQPQRRGNKQQFQVPPLPPQRTSAQSSKGQGQGGGVVSQNSQSTSQTRNAQTRNTRGTQRNNLQQQVFAPNQSQHVNGGQEQSPPRIQQVLRPPASQASSAAQLPVQNQVSMGGVTGGVQSQSAQYDFGSDYTNQQFSQNQQNNQASTMPASQASVSGQRQQLQQHNGGGSSYIQPQSAPAIGQRLEGVVHGPQHTQSASNTQALGGAMMGSSGNSSLIGGDMGGMTERIINSRNQGPQPQQMNAESGSTSGEFSSQQRQVYPPYLSGGSNALQTSANAYQQVSSPPSTAQNLRSTTNLQQNLQQNSQQSTHNEQEGGSATGGGEADLFVASIGATPLAQNNLRGAITSAMTSSQQQQNFMQRQQFVSQQQQAYFQSTKPSSSGEPVDAMQNVSSGGAAAGNNISQGDSGANMVNQRTSYQQQQQARTDSRKTSGANTPSKDGADTPPYRDQLQNNSYILNLTSKRLLGLQQRTGAQNEESVQIQDEVFSQHSQQPQPQRQMRPPMPQQQPNAIDNKVIPRNMFE